MIKKNITLIIDTSSNQEIAVGLEINKEKFVIEKPLDQRKAQIVLPLIDTILKNHKLVLKDLSEIKVNTGPGSFTGLRVGVSIANTLGYLLQIPINGKKVGEMDEPKY